MTLPERVDRRAFWTWATPLVAAHVGLAALAVAGVNAVGALDTFIIIILAMLVARRFRDIGWRGWIGGTFMIASMVVAPLAVTAYAIAGNLQFAQATDAMNSVGLVVGIANLVLLVVSGSVRGSGRADPIPAGAVDALQPPAEARSPSAAQDARRAPSVVAMTAGIMLETLVVVVAVVGIGIALSAPPPYATSAPSAPSAGQLPGVQPNREPRPPVQNWTLESERNGRSR